tara:strand:+ start:52 stop:309 length:258 start_codon:yes stop_codon:yes gene_type:complete
MAVTRKVKIKKKDQFMVLISSCGSADQLYADGGRPHFTEADARDGAIRAVENYVGNQGEQPGRVVIAKIVDVASPTGLTWGQTID